MLEARTKSCSHRVARLCADGDSHFLQDIDRILITGQVRVDSHISIRLRLRKKIPYNFAEIRTANTRRGVHAETITLPSRFTFIQMTGLLKIGNSCLGNLLATFDIWLIEGIYTRSEEH